MNLDPLALYPKCPHCGEKIGFFNRAEHCAYSDEIVCNKCIVSGRFSDSVSDKIPKEFREKFRFFNILPWVIVITAAFLVLQSGWYRFGGWQLTSESAFLSGAAYILEMWVLGFIMILVSLKLPHLGDWMFYWWMSNPKNKQRVANAVAEQEEGCYQSDDKVFSLKTKVFDYLKETNMRVIFIITANLNIAMIPLFFIMTYYDNSSGTYFSAIVGVVFSLSLIFNFLVIAIAAGFYSHKNPENHSNRIIISTFSWAYVLLMPVIYFPFLLGMAWKINAMEELVKSLAGIDFGYMLIIYQVAFTVQSLVMIGLIIFMMLKGSPNFVLQQTKFMRVKKDPMSIIKRFVKVTLTIIFFTILLVLFFFAIFICLIDPAMALGIVSPTYLLFGAFIPIIFIVLKLVDRRPKKYTQFFWTCVKLSAIVIVVSAAPALLTPTWTNTSLENQFDASFGADWEDDIPEELRAKMRDVPFSAFENFFGFNIDYSGAARYDVVYGTDSPRYVYMNVGEERVILSNGTSKYTQAVREFPFDVYLPPNEEFGVGTDKYPVIIFCHGIGMSKGTGNANFSISRYFANQGYVVFDMEYGRTGWERNSSDIGHSGYDFPDTIKQVGMFTHYLEARVDEYHADLDNVWFSGRSFGGWMTTVMAYGYNTTFFGTNFSSAMTVRGAIPFYGAHAIPDAGELMSLEFLGPDGMDFYDNSAPYFRGSCDPEDDDYNPEWDYYNPYKMANSSFSGTDLCPTLMFHGTQDPLVPPGWDTRLQATLSENGHTALLGLYPLGSHAADVFHFSQYGQSILYYMERFLALTRVDL